MSSVKKIEWDNMSNRLIREKLQTLKHEHESLRQKMLLMTNYMKELELDYLSGNETLIKRQKGE